MSRSNTDPAELRAHVYPIREDSRLLARHANAAPGEVVLEIGCGRGLAATVAAERARRVVATDLNPYALRELRAHARKRTLPIEAVRTDLAAGLKRFHTILCNPPYLPTSEGSEDPDRWTDLMLNGGPDGCRVVRRVVAELEPHLVPGGRALIVCSSRQRESELEAILEAFRRQGGSVRVVDAEQFEGETLTLRELRLIGPEGNQNED